LHRWLHVVLGLLRDGGWAVTDDGPSV
jgi:hypothetical protein